MALHVVAGPCPPAYQILWRHLKWRPSYGGLPFSQNSGQPPSWILLPVKNDVTARCGLSISTPCQIWWQYLKWWPSYCDFHFSKWRPTAILDFDTGQKWRYGRLQTVHAYHLAKFFDCISIGGWVIASAILNFCVWQFWTTHEVHSRTWSHTENLVLIKLLLLKISWL